MERIRQAILFVRGLKVMLDRDLAMLYGVETRALNQAVKRNCDRFPDDFMFALTREEIMTISQFVISSPELKYSKKVNALNGMDVVVTWNVAHLNNLFTRMMVRQIVEDEGYRCPEICSPDELLEIDR